MKSLFLMCGPAGSGKSTWVKAQMAEAKYPCRWVSRDNVRNTFLTDADKNSGLRYSLLILLLESISATFRIFQQFSFSF